MEHSEINCVLCNGRFFRKGYIQTDTDLKLYLYPDNDNLFIDYDQSIESETSFYLESEDDNKSGYIRDDEIEVYYYACDDCGFIMNFTQEKNVISKKEKQKKKQRENNYDWTRFDK